MRRRRSLGVLDFLLLLEHFALLLVFLLELFVLLLLLLLNLLLPHFIGVLLLQPLLFGVVLLLHLLVFGILLLLELLDLVGVFLLHLRIVVDRTRIGRTVVRIANVRRRIGWIGILRAVGIIGNRSVGIATRIIGPIVVGLNLGVGGLREVAIVVAIRNGVSSRWSDANWGHIGVGHFGL